MDNLVPELQGAVSLAFEFTNERRKLLVNAFRSIRDPFGDLLQWRLIKVAPLLKVKPL